MLAMINGQFALTVFAVLTVGTMTASAHKSATGIVKQRMEAMKVMRTNLKAVAAMLKGKRPYDAAQVKRAAIAIRKHALDMPKLFPKDSTQRPSDARPEIWKRWPEFKKSANELAAHAEALAQAAGNPTTSDAKAVFTNVGKNCSGCHKAFRKTKR